MRHLTSYESPVDLSQPEERLAVKSALKRRLERDLAQQASTSGAGPGAGTTPQHMAGPGRCTAAAGRSGNHGAL